MNCDGNELEMKRPDVRADSLRKDAMRLSSSLAVASNVNGRFPGGAYSDNRID